MSVTCVRCQQQAPYDAAVGLLDYCGWKPDAVVEDKQRWVCPACQAQRMAEAVKEEGARYLAALCAMQSGVAYKMQYEGSEVTPKHLRVGVNSALVDSAALTSLLIAKGLITEAEYAKALADAMEAEVGRYRQWLSQRLGGEVDLA